MKQTKKATRFAQTGRTGYLLAMTVQELLNHAPAPEPHQLQLDLFTETNRPITGKHLGAIERFLQETPNWAIPPVILAVEKGAVQERSGSITFNTEDLSILDGQHRIQAFANAVHEMSIAAERTKDRERLDRMKAQEIPAVILEVENKRDQRQIFAWFARSRPIEPAVREYFDQSDPFGNAAKNVMEDSRTLNGNVTHRVRNVPPRDRDLMSLTNLREIITAIQLGTTRTPRAEDRAALQDEATRRELEEKALDLFDRFLPRCAPNYGFLDSPGEIRQRIIGERSVSHAPHPQVMRLLASAWARWTHDLGRDPDILAKHIGQLRMRRADPENCIESALELTEGPKGKFKGIRNRAWEEAVRTIIKNAEANG